MSSGKSKFFCFRIPPGRKMGVPGLGHQRSFGGSRPQTSPPRFLELAAPPAALARAFARLEKDLRLSIGKSLSRQGQPEISLLLK
jgi:hypothetical protein